MPSITLIVNGEEVTVSAPAERLLLDLLREDLGLTGAKRGCDTGECGCCTVLLDGLAVRSCLSLAVRMQGRSVTTIEGVGRPNLHPVQAAFVDAGALQCGYCTPGMVMLTVAFLTENADPSDEEIRRMLSSNLCRCTGYKPIEAAVRSAAATLRRREER